MKAAVLVEQNQPLVLAEIELPAVLTPGQVMVEIQFSGICGSQLGEIDGVKGPDKYLPHLLGHEGSGVVLNTGPGVKKVKAGDKVVLHWRKSSGIESDTPVYSWDGRPVNSGWITTFNECAVISENRLTRIPDDSEMDVAALVGCAVTTGFGVVVNNANLKPGESVVIFGSGGIGLNMVQAAAMVSAFPVIAVDLYDEKLSLARKMGATHTVNARDENAEEAIRKIMNGTGLDVFVDNTGNTKIIEAGYALTADQGRVILVGVPRKGDKISFYSLPLHFGKIITGSHGGEADPDRDIPRYQRLYAIGRLNLKELITQSFSLDEINEAIDGVRNGAVSGRCIIKM